MLAGADWPLQYSDAGPEVFYSYNEGVKEHHAILHPEHHLGETSIEHLAVAFEPPDRRSWIEPVQSFVLFWGASPHLGRDGHIGWEIPDEDGKPEIIATLARSVGFGPVLEPPSGALLIAPSADRNDQSMPTASSYSNRP